MQARHSVSAVYTLSAITALSGLLFGFDTGIISGALLFLQKDFTLTTTLKELIVSSVLPGAMAGSLLSGRLTDLFGRKRLMLAVATLFMLGTTLAALAPSVIQIILGRFFIGTSIGIGSYTAPLYIAEISPSALRGRLVSLNQLAITIGILTAFIISHIFTHIGGSWRWMISIGFIPAVLLLMGMVFLPESPRWLIRQNRTKEAVKSLKRLRGTKNIDHELHDIQNSLQIKQASFREIFTPWILPVLLFGAMLGFMQQVTGINTIIYYAPTIFQMAGFHGASSATLATIGLGVVNVISTVFAVLFIDRIGRRPLLLTGLAGMCLSLLGLSLAFSQGADHLNILHWVALSCTFLYIICFAFSLGAILWLLVSEIFPLEVRGAAMSVAVFNCWLWNFAVSASFLTLLEHLGPTRTFLLYASMCVFSLIFCWYKAPETRGVTLEQIENNIRKRLPLRTIGQHSREAIKFS